MSLTAEENYLFCFSNRSYWSSTKLAIVVILMHRAQYRIYQSGYYGRTPAIRAKQILRTAPTQNAILQYGTPNIQTDSQTAPYLCVSYLLTINNLKEYCWSLSSTAVYDRVLISRLSNTWNYVAWWDKWRTPKNCRQPRMSTSLIVISFRFCMYFVLFYCCLGSSN